MLRGCLLALVLYAALSVGYFFWLNTVFEPPTSYWASALVGFVVLCCLGALVNARNAYRDWSLMSSDRRGVPRRDGRLIAVAGTIEPVGPPLVAPFSGAPCVLCEYDLSRPRRYTGSQGKENTGSDFAGFLMTPCVIRSSRGDVKLLGFPLLDGFGESVHDSFGAARRAIDFLTTRQFEDRSGLKLVTLITIFDDVWSDDDGLVEKNIRLGKIKLPDLFPPELEAEIDKQLAMGELDQTDSPSEEIEDDDVDDDLDDLDASAESVGGYSSPQVPHMTEKRVDIGAEVCAIGRYSEMHGGLFPARGSTTPNRLVHGNAEHLENKSRGAIVGYLVGGVVALLVAHGATFGVMQAYLHSSELAKHREKEAFQAVAQGDLAKLERLIKRGMDINIRGANQQTPLMAAKDPGVAAWLIQHGADVNAVDQDGETALMRFARSGEVEFVKLLIAANADLNLRSTSYNRTALMNADSSGRAEVAAMLRQAGAEDDVVTSANGQPLPADGGPPLAVCRAYLQAIQDRNPAALRAAYVSSTKIDFDDVDWQLWQRVRPNHVESWTGFVRGDDATITIEGPTSAGNPVVWIYQVRRTGGEWRIARERDNY